MREWLKEFLWWVSLDRIFEQLLIIKKNTRPDLSGWVSKCLPLLEHAYGSVFTSYPLQKGILRQRSMWTHTHCSLLDRAFGMVWQSLIPPVADRIQTECNSTLSADNPQSFFYVLETICSHQILHKPSWKTKGWSPGADLGRSASVINSNLCRVSL